MKQLKTLQILIGTFLGLRDVPQARTTGMASASPPSSMTLLQLQVTHSLVYGTKHKFTVYECMQKKHYFCLSTAVVHAGVYAAAAAGAAANGVIR